MSEEKKVELKWDLNDLYQKAVWFIITSVAVYGATQMRALNASVDALNLKMVEVVTNQTNYQDNFIKTATDHELRIRKLEAERR